MRSEIRSSARSAATSCSRTLGVTRQELAYQRGNNLNEAGWASEADQPVRFCPGFRNQGMGVLSFRLHAAAPLIELLPDVGDPKLPA